MLHVSCYMNLVIVESPTKAKTIQRFLPAGFTVKSSYGHVRDLPKGKLGIDVENDFEPKYVVSLLARKRLAEIKKILPKVSKVILATDEDREGEAISWHLTHALGLPTTDYRLQPEKNKPANAPPKKAVDGSRSTVVVERIVFHEITKSAIEKALRNPRKIDMDLVNAQQARRILDRLVGYELSPFLWRKVAKGLSAGRVQSTTVRLIVEREREIQKFKPEEYWSIEALLAQRPTADCQQPTEFTASLIKKNNQPISKLGIKTANDAQKILDDLKGAEYKIAEILQKEVNKHPAPPLITSTLQQEAVKKFGFSAKQTMQIAQQLYEGIELGSEGSIGLITYMRTDSVNLADEAIAQIEKYIGEKFGKNYLTIRAYKTKNKGAQEAHEAIRPTDIFLTPEKIKQFLTSHQFKLYNLIWRRALTCQMASAVLSATTIDIDADVILSEEKDLKKDSSVAILPQNDKKNNIFTFRANGSQIKFDGFLKVYDNLTKEITLPPLQKNEILNLLKLVSGQHFTQPPPRYSEAMLIKTLEEYGIGRPSTYAPTISTIQERNYVQKDNDKKFSPTEIGFLVNDLLVEHFPQIVDYQFTALMEEDLDAIAESKKEWVPVIRNFYQPFAENLARKYTEVEKQKPEPELTDKICPQCGAGLLIRTSRFGKFYACSAFPKCRYTENMKNALNLHCPKCVEGDIVEKRTKRGKIFYGCSRYPECDFASWDKPVGQKCPACDSPLVETKKGIRCHNKECKYQEK